MHTNRIAHFNRLTSFEFETSSRPARSTAPAAPALVSIPQAFLARASSFQAVYRLAYEQAVKTVEDRRRRKALAYLWN
jgi:hypothetical protein